MPSSEGCDDFVGIVEWALWSSRKRLIGHCHVRRTAPPCSLRA